MNYRFHAIAALWLIGGAALAQTAPATQPGASDSWATRPASSSTTFSNQSTQKSKAMEHFKFKDRSPKEPPPPNANDKASVMGTDRAWQDGRPPVDCAASPHSSGCP